MHHFFEFVALHLTVPHRDPSLRDNLLNHARHAIDGFDPVVEEEDLSPSGEFPKDRALHHFGFVLHDIGLDRQPILWRGVDQRHVAHTTHRHIQGSRDGSGGEGQNIHLAAELLEGFFVLDPEALFLVDNNQSRDP